MTVRLVNWLSRNEKFKVAIVVLSPEGPVRELVEKNVELVDVGARRASRAVVALGRFLKYFQPDVVIPSLPHVSVVVLLAKVLGQHNCSVVVWERNIYRPLASHRTHLRLQVLHVAVSILYRFADGIVFNSPLTEISFRQSRIKLPAFSKTLPNLVDEDIGKRQAGEGQVLPARFVLGAGRLTTQKGFDILIKSVSLVEDSNFTLVIAGEGPDELALRELSLELGISDRIVFLGFVDNLRELMARCEVFVLSSRWEGFGNVVVEALQEGAQVISFDCPGGPGWILDSGRFGLLVPNGNFEALAEAIGDVLIFGRQHPRELVISRGDEYRSETIGPLFLNEVISHFSGSTRRFENVRRAPRENS